MQNTKHFKQPSLRIFLNKRFDKSLFCLACSSWDFSNGGSDDSKCCLKVVFTLLSIVAIQKCAPDHTLSPGIVYRKMMGKLVQFLVIGVLWRLYASALCPRASIFLDASTHLYKRVCPSVGWLVGWSVGPWWSSWGWWKCIESWKYLRLLDHSVDFWLVHTPRITSCYQRWCNFVCFMKSRKMLCHCIIPHDWCNIASFWTS